ncbi:aminotransferase class I/II-fold pyridoxal phosphate-dependent enzyme [bacterium]|nr:aminotransferase class I/II-fold pyridoxal phosphate-dependent enzyme [bacterium]
MSENYYRKDIEDLPDFKVENIKATLKLDQNEYPEKLPKYLRNKIFHSLKNKYTENRYPQPIDYLNKKKKISEFLGISEKNLIFTMGADQGILATMIISGKKVKIFTPTYPIPENDAKILSKELSIEALKYENDFVLSKEQIGKNLDLIYLVSPNSPVGNIIDDELVEYVCKNNQLVVIDEAYFEYSNKTYIELLKKHENLIIIRTFSKACGLAGYRFGYVFANEKIISLMEKVLFVPYNLGLCHYAIMDNFSEIFTLGMERGKIVQKIRDEFYLFLKKNSFKSYKSYGNFLFFEASRKLYDELLSKGIKTRYYHIESKDFIRISIGTKKEMDQLKKELKGK